MPTMTGTISGQNVGFRIVSSGSSGNVDEVTLNLSFRDITADSALSLLTHSNKSIWAECGFSSISSFQEGIEDFDPGVPRVVRRGVAFLTFRTAVHSCRVNSRWSIFYWQQQTALAEPAVLEPEHVRSFVGYDRNSGDVVYTHELLREPGCSTEGEGMFEPDALERRIKGQFEGRNVSVIQAPDGFRRQDSIRYRVDPGTKTIETSEPALSFGGFARDTAGD